MPDTASYVTLDKLLHRGDKPVPSRKVANHTYAQRRLNCCESPARMYLASAVTYLDCIAIRYHDTDIVTFHSDGTITLDSGGWLTMSTRERMNRFLPSPLVVHSIKGRWMVTTRSVTLTYSDDDRDEDYTRPDYEHSTPYVDGIKFAPANPYVLDMANAWVVANGLSPSEQAKQDAHNARVEKLLDAYLRWLDVERYEDIVNSQYSRANDKCGMCVLTGVGTMVGDEFEDKQHLIEHLIDKSVPWQVFKAACDQAYGGDGTFRMKVFDLAKRDLRKYLRTQLYVGPVAIKGGKRPAHQPSWSLSVQLNKSRRKSA